ncbi:MAG TPA: 3-carboxy-cis,cis-muconate cycloisomerase [Bauldia sp.]|nr:3-carboxy-cis,cis-muconate cycloisomerase [Bauldia sp.]
MSVSPFDDPLLAALLGDEESARLFTPETEIGEFNVFEAALARAEAAEGVIPSAAADAIVAAAADLTPDMASLRAAVARDGVVVPEYVRQLRQMLPAAHSEWLHFGTTSQDLIDTALVRRLVPIVMTFDARLTGTLAALDGLDRRFSGNKIMGRTRMQDALPITVADRLRSWREPLVRHRTRLAELKPRLLVLQFGGAVGTRDKLGGKGEAVAGRLADALGLAPAAPWHSQRDNLAEFTAWLALVSGSLGKIGADIVLMAQNTVGEVMLADAGSSSAMPHKANPVRAELLVALAHFTAALSSAMATALVHEQERSGAAWTLEWLTLPQMVMATGAALNTASALLASVTRMGGSG